MPQSINIATRVRGKINRILGRKGLEDSDDYQLLTNGQSFVSDGWKQESAVERQHQAFQRLLQEVRAGRPRIDFIVAARAIESTGLTNPLIVEVGCGSGYYSEALRLLLQGGFRYVGLDFSPAMIDLAHATYEQVPFLAADACRLPLRDSACDILLSGTSLMHIAEYRLAISESVRASRQWCIFHTVPLIKNRATTLLHKLAYGQRVVEVIFNQSELELIFREHGLVTEHVFESIPYDLSSILGEPSWTATYLCRKI